jgi:hypothetical protein
MSAPIIKRGFVADAAKEADSERLKIVILDDDKTVLAHAEMDQSIARALDIPLREPDIVAPAPEEIANSNLRSRWAGLKRNHKIAIGSVAGLVAIAAAGDQGVRLHRENACRGQHPCPRRRPDRDDR